MTSVAAVNTDRYSVHLTAPTNTSPKVGALSQSPTSDKAVYPSFSGRHRLSTTILTMPNMLHVGCSLAVVDSYSKTTTAGCSTYSKWQNSPAAPPSHRVHPEMAAPEQNVGQWTPQATEHNDVERNANLGQDTDGLSYCAYNMSQSA